MNETNNDENDMNKNNSIEEIIEDQIIKLQEHAAESNRYLN